MNSWEEWLAAQGGSARAVRPTGKQAAGEKVDPLDVIEFGNEDAARGRRLTAVQRHMTVDQLVFSGGKSDPETGTYWLAYRPVAEEDSPF